MQEINLYDLIKYYFKYWYVVVMLMLAGLGIGYGYNQYYQVPLYKSDATLLVINTDSSASKVDTKQINNYIQLVKSRRVLEPVMSNMGLSQGYQELADTIQTSNEKETEVLKISITSTVAATSRNSLDGIIDSFRTELAKLYSKDNIQVVDGASTPREPYNVNKPLQLALATVAGLLLAIISLFFAYDYKINNAKAGAKPKKHLIKKARLKIISSINHIKAQRKQKIAQNKVKSAVRAKIKAAARLKAQAEAQAKAKARAQAQAQAKVDADIKAQAQAKAKADADVKAQAEAKAQAQAKATAKTQAQAKVQAKADERKAKRELKNQAKATQRKVKATERKAKARKQSASKARATKKAKAELIIQAKKAEVDHQYRLEQDKLNQIANAQKLALAQVEAKKAQAIRDVKAIQRANRRQERRDKRIALINSKVAAIKQKVAENRESREQQRKADELNRAKLAKSKAENAKAENVKADKLAHEADIAKMFEPGRAKGAKQAAKFMLGAGANSRSAWQTLMGAMSKKNNKK